MNAGCHSHIWSVRILLGFSVLLLLAGTSIAGTSDPACATEPLWLISPDEISMRLNNDGRSGVELSWADLDPAEATCFGLVVPDSIEAEITTSGDYLDSMDRIFRFVSADSGAVGGAPIISDPSALGNERPRSLRITWSNIGPSINGIYEGSFNLANNGGFMRLAGGDGGAWETMNQNLPMTWYQMNVTAFAEGSNGVLFAGLSGGSVPDSDSKGFYTNTGSGWEILGESYFPSSRAITAIEVSPNDNNLIAVGTDRDGLFMSIDGGNTFTQWTYDFDPDFADQPGSYNVSAMMWSGDKLIVAMPNYGIFMTDNNGATFSRVDFTVPQDLDSAVIVPVIPVIRDFTVDPSNPNHFLAALVFHGAWESMDGGETWTDLYGDLNIVDAENPGAWIFSGLSILVDSTDSQIILMGCDQRGLYRTADGGDTWIVVGESAQPDNTAILNRFSLAQRSSVSGEFFVFEDNWGLIYSTDYGVTWNEYPDQPTFNRGYNFVASKDGQDYLLGTTYGGIYVAGSNLNLSDTYTTGTSSQLVEIDLGLGLQISNGTLDQFDTFDLVGQTFQGWAVWRSLSHDMENMSLIGFYDKVNPEDCIEGYCGDVSYDIIPNCYAAKKAACFNFDTSDTVRFFDQEVYEGFSYYYAVTSYDYGNTALTTPENNTNEMVFSPKFDNDEGSQFPGPGNRTFFAINSMVTADISEEGIYVFPNPLRAGAGLPGEEGETVVFTNLPAGSRVRIFTTAGDDVINLGPDNQVGNNIRWTTTNRESEKVSPGVYLYKVEMAHREDYWGKVVIIR